MDIKNSGMGVGIPESSSPSCVPKKLRSSERHYSSLNQNPYH